MSVIVKQLNDRFIWVPATKGNVRWESDMTIILEYEEMDKIWSLLGYDFSMELDEIGSFEYIDLERMWLLNSGALIDFTSSSVKKAIYEMCFEFTRNR
ncbi:hypothetical protein [Mechercharimyces sp. CAU 1602]|uniref:hypothetical protein n=1 Tax=Mechercharimyces sp. CAU 1602 TaxID=2973933 RepID=UPI002162F8A8|nr:hypothetical protein [Mechercharimyces sp. CAU 1602]MCS1351404.1 hypothetical protein [Mechercharimyces sp. CAU 1602]